jgi:hypothetical protein
MFQELRSDIATIKSMLRGGAGAGAGAGSSSASGAASGDSAESKRLAGAGDRVGSAAGQRGNGSVSPVPSAAAGAGGPAGTPGGKTMYFTPSWSVLFADTVSVLVAQQLAQLDGALSSLPGLGLVVVDLCFHLTPFGDCAGGRQLGSEHHRQ